MPTARKAGSIRSLTMMFAFVIGVCGVPSGNGRCAVLTAVAKSASFPRTELEVKVA